MPARRGRPPLPLVPHEAAGPGEAAFACRGGCDLLWPTRLRPSHLNLCPNCLRAYKRSRSPSHVARRRHLKRAYAVTPEWVKTQLDAQDGACAICSREIALPEGAVPKRGEANVDHDHKFGLVRALLCGPCNRGLGAFDDDPRRLRAAAAYVERHAKTSEDVDAHLAKLTTPEPERRAPRAPEPRYDPNESIDSIVSRMNTGDEVFVLPASTEKKRR